MINVKSKACNGNIVSISLKGHSGYSEAGSDVVCSAVTAISCSIGDGILNVLKVKANCIADEGRILISLENNSLDDIEECQVLMKTLLLGLRNIESNYGDYIKVFEEEV
ncbi:ribosomal-processing cysteine protease Prp [Haloimpatiens sp. FM7315]|uniref:ribosomal-processing cysteine protease Prp n=1 Tax=Haloimpatiens sp. FM7315 TaxID=3298609 RepID=UPI0035A2E5F7